MRARRIRKLIWLVVVLTGLGVGGRRLVLSRALYRLNLGETADLPEMPEPRAGQRILIFAPHQDDETLGCAGYIQRAVAAGARVHVVLMTNGEYPELSLLITERTLHKTPDKFIRLGYMRQSETVGAAASLGLDATALTFLGYPNNYLDRMWLPSNWSPENPVRSARTHATRSPYGNSMTPGAIHCGESVLADIEALLRRHRPDTVLTVDPNDVHVDHWPTYGFVKLALIELAVDGNRFAADCALYGYLIHRPHWPAPRGYKPWLRMEPPALLHASGSPRWYSLPLTLEQTMVKREAIGLYHSQGGSVSPFLHSFARANELFTSTAEVPWSVAANVVPTPVIDDPRSDIDSAAAAPAGDIVQVKVGRREGRLIVGLVTAGPINGHTHYHISVHCIGRSRAERAVCHYTWQARAARGRIYRGGVLKDIAADTLHSETAGRSARLYAPWPGTDTGPATLMVRAWSTRRGRVLDETTIATIDVPAPRAQDGG